MQLLVVSHTAHYEENGAIVGWGPTIREIDYLAKVFESVVHIAPMHKGSSPKSAIPYQAANVRLRTVAPSGGTRLSDKVSILVALPSYIRAILCELRQADVVHVRCPANISLTALILLAIVRHPRVRWGKYAGSWKPVKKEAISYGFQRWWLERGFHRGIVTINGHWQDQPIYVHSLLNPCLTDEEIADAKALVSTKQLSSPVRLIFVGSLETSKGVHRALHILARLLEKGVQATLDFVGDGPEKLNLTATAVELGIQQSINLHGWLGRNDLTPIYARSHIMVFPSDSEGWPKVLSEGMAYGVVPVSSNVSSIPHYLAQFDCGVTLDPDDINGFVNAIVWYCSTPSQWKTESERGIKGAANFSYNVYLRAIGQALPIPPRTSSFHRV